MPHGSNQAEILFPIVRRKALTPTTSRPLPDLARHLMDFAQHYRNIPWTFTRSNLDCVLAKVTEGDTPPLALAA